MKVNCLHGFFIFEETAAGQAANWMARYGLPLVPRGTGFTFEQLEDAPSYSITGKPLVGVTPAVTTFAGEPWEVFEANGMVYDFANGLLVPIAAVVQPTVISQAGKYYVASGGGLIMPGSITTQGKIKSYSGWYSRERLTWLYSEVTLV